jgi:hypothetical protein
MNWHVPGDDLMRYAAGAAVPPTLWSTEAHLGICPDCRGRLASVSDPGRTTAGWARLDAELDAPRPGAVERVLLRLRVPDHTARLLAATPALRRSWLTAVASTIALTALVANLAQPTVFLAVVPLLPLAGVAASFGPGVDPTYELTVVAPMHTFRLLLLRCAAVLATTCALSGVATLTMPEHGLRALGWFLPALALTVLALVLTPRLGAVPAAAVVGAGWLAVLAATEPGPGMSPVFTPAGQLTTVLVAVVAAAALARLRPAFDTAQHTVHRTPRRGTGRLT